MKTVKLFLVAAVATVAFASCGGGDAAKTADSTTVVMDTTTVMDTTPVAPADTTVSADTTKK